VAFSGDEEGSLEFCNDQTWDWQYRPDITFKHLVPPDQFKFYSQA
jgi:hypothetical protein